MHKLLTTRGPWLCTTVASPSEIDDVLLGLAYFREIRIAARRLRGDKMQKHMALFDEFAAALQFPSYFGHNWDALDECLHDLRWLNAENFILITTNAPALLHHDAANLPILLKVLAQTGLSWSQAAPERQRPARPFHSIFVCSSEVERAELEKRFTTAGVQAPQVSLIELTGILSH